MLRAQNINGRSQNETDWFHADVSHAPLSHILPINNVTINDFFCEFPLDFHLLR